MSVEERDVRKFIRSKLTPEQLSPKPLYFLYIFLPLAVLLLSYRTIISTDNFLIKIFVSVLIGTTHASLGFFGHELMHGSMVKSKVLKYLATWPGLYIYLIGPTLWDEWHNKTHHFFTMGIKDPDRYFLKDELDSIVSIKDKKMALHLIRTAPGSGTISSYFTFFIYFFKTAQMILWFSSKNMNLSRKKIWLIRFEVLISFCIWMIIFYIFGITNGIYALVIPAIVSSFLLMFFIITNHSISPITERNNSLMNSMSLNTWKILDLIFFNFSLHVEHHLLPSIHWTERKKVQSILREYYK